MITYQGTKVTATQFAKLVIGDAVSQIEEFWHERQSEDAEMMTDKEREQVEAALTKQADRVYKLLRYWEERERWNKLDDEHGTVSGWGEY